jgi:hypothetical protein
MAGSIPQAGFVPGLALPPYGDAGQQLRADAHPKIVWKPSE